MSSYVVVDLEMCNVPRGARREAFHASSELIQIGAVLIDDNYRITDSFMTYVAPELVAWSGNDRAQIQREIRGKELSIPRLDTYMDEECWIDCQALFADKLDTSKSFRLSEALLLAEIEFDDGAHDALIDARNTAKLFEKVQREEVLTLSPYLIRSDMYDSYTFNPFRNACRVGAC